MVNLYSAFLFLEKALQVRCRGINIYWRFHTYRPLLIFDKLTRSYLLYMKNINIRGFELISNLFLVLDYIEEHCGSFYRSWAIRLVDQLRSQYFGAIWSKPQNKTCRRNVVYFLCIFVYISGFNVPAH